MVLNYGLFFNSAQTIVHIVWNSKLQSPACAASNLIAGSNMKSYVVGAILGYGSFGIVISCRRMSDSQRVALKMFK